MEAKVTRAFTDRFTGAVHRPGETFAGEEARVAELAEGGWVDEPLPAEKPKKKAPAKKKAE